MCFINSHTACPIDKNCKICHNKSFASHEKSKYWSDKNTLKPWQLKQQSNKKYWFNCDFGHDFETTLQHVIENKWCPYACCCSSPKKICLENSCEICYIASFANHEKAEFWSDKNILKPREVFKNTPKQFWFKCDKSNHEFEMSLSNIIRGSWCPYPCCNNYGGNRKLCIDENCEICFKSSFASHHISEFWSDKNECYPRQILLNSNKKYWFKCNKSEHDFEISLNNINHNDRWCPYPCCAGQKLCLDAKCLICLNASFASHHRSEFWSNKNKLTPREVFKSTNIKHYFVCENDHEFEMDTGHITQRNSWCPKCCIWKNQNDCIDIIEKITEKKFERNIKLKILKNLELDGYNEELKIAIEYNGKQHYEYVSFFHNNCESNLVKQKKRDNLKKELCDKNGIHLIVVPYWINDKENFINDKLYL